jgi:hypothetical protein
MLGSLAVAAACHHHSQQQLLLLQVLTDPQQRDRRPFRQQHTPHWTRLTPASWRAAAAVAEAGLQRLLLWLCVYWVHRRRHHLQTVLHTEGLMLLEWLLLLLPSRSLLAAAGGVTLAAASVHHLSGCCKHKRSRSATQHLQRAKHKCLNSPTKARLSFL